MQALLVIIALSGGGAIAALKLRPRFVKARGRIAPRKRSGRRSALRPAKERAHDYRKCGDRKCQQLTCRVFREGQQACPLPHQG